MFFNSLSRHRAALDSLYKGLFHNLWLDAVDFYNGDVDYKKDFVFGEYRVRQLISFGGRDQSLIVRNNERFIGTLLLREDKFKVIGIDSPDRIDDLIAALLECQEQDQIIRTHRNWTPPEDADLTNVVPLFGYNKKREK